MIDVKSHEAVDHYSYKNHPNTPKQLVITLSDDITEFGEAAQELERRLNKGQWTYEETRNRFGDTRLVYTPREKNEEMPAKTPTLKK